MARAIDADELQKKFLREFDHNNRLVGKKVVAGAWQGAMQLLYDAPTIDTVKQEWISVEDRLPEQYSGVIVFDGDCVGEAEYDGKRFHWSADEDIAFATHWMPLPEPPKCQNEPLK